ncbi:MAG: adenosine nucleotide hydrolase [Ktedonobacterales bacterium]
MQADQHTDAPYAVCFSGGKDSMLALDRARRSGVQVVRLVTLYDGPSERIRFHAVPVTVMRAQAEALGLPVSLYPTTPLTFEEVFVSALDTLRADGIHGLIFGNIHLADVRKWYEDRVRAAGLEHVEPLWSEAPERLVREVVSRGYRAVLTCTEESNTDPGWLGQPISEELIAAFERRGIDPCGEHGEYHTLVTNGPLFHVPLAVHFGAMHVDGDPHLGGRFRQLDIQLRGGESA